MSFYRYWLSFWVSWFDMLALLAEVELERAKKADCDA